MSGPQFIRSGLPLRVEIPAGGHNATSKSAHTGADIRRTEVDPKVLTQASTVIRLAGHVSLQPLHSTDSAHARDLAQPTTPALASLAPLGEQSHLSTRISQLKADNNKIRAQLEQLESPVPSFV